MRQAHGFVEYCQLGEWLAVLNVGSLLVSNTQLSALLFEVAGKYEGRSVPGDVSPGFEALYTEVREHVSGVAVFSYRQACALYEQAAAGMQQPEVASLLNETQFDTLMDLCGVLARRFGDDNLRLVLYFE